MSLSVLILKRMVMFHQEDIMILSITHGLLLMVKKLCLSTRR